MFDEEQDIYIITKCLTTKIINNEGEKHNFTMEKTG